ncbi:MAG TPA: hypothetical protein VEV38_06265 [Candidatus Eremiobacteraceae bacterium]|nr:hypothetical protein [Candidatus Eremiobacteraceae bacterium]
MAIDLIAELGGALPSGALVREWRSLQAKHTLRWGAWLGIRHDGAHAMLKLYVEVPREAIPLSIPGLEAIVPSSRLLMIGYDCTRGSQEVYFRQPPMSEVELDGFTAFMHADSRRRCVLDEFASLCGLPAWAALRWTNYGYSIARETPASDILLSLFIRSRSIGDASRIRRQFLNSVSRSTTTAAYRSLIGDVADEDLPDHGMVSLIARKPGEIEMRVGLSATALARLCVTR